MIRTRLSLTCALAALTVMQPATGSWLGVAQAQELLQITARSAVAAYDELKQTATIPEFRIGGTYDLDDPASWESGGVGGTTLESLGQGPLRLSYIAVGTPVRDESGQIVNAVVIPSFYSGDATSMYDQWVVGSALSGGTPVIGPGALIDTDRFYVVMFDAIGLWGTSKPSDGLGMDFPQYSYYDMVQAQYRVLRDELEVGRVALVTGLSMGATQTHLWGVLHSPSGFVRSVMPIGGATQEDGTDPVRAWVFQLATAGLESDPVWKETGGRYYDRPKEEHPNDGVKFHWSALLHTGFDFDHRVTQDWDTVKRDIFYWDPEGDASANLVGMAANFDAVDLYYRNRTGLSYNINDDLTRSRADTLVMHITNDNWLNAQLAQRSADAIPGARFIGEDHPLSHYAIFGMPNRFRGDPVFRDFLETVALAANEPHVDLPNFRAASVATEIDPEKSFWKDHVTYPFPVKFETGTDALGREWEIGYMDEYVGTEENPPTLVIIHGKGAFAGHYGNIISHALRRGLRVIAPDLPSYGMSGPGNLDLDESRTMQNMREAIHDVIVNKLGVDQAYYHGHSLGGQFVMGYALNWPEAVAGLILEAPAGLEEFPMEINMGGGNTLAMFDPALANQGQKWREVWEPLGLFQAEFDRTAESVEDFFNFFSRDAAGNRVPAAAGYFKRETPYARLHTDQRIAMISGNAREFDQWVAAFIWDIHAIAAENLQGDPDNLYRRLTGIEAPIFLAFGAEEPFIPSTALNGLSDMANDVIAPFMARMTAAGNAPILKIYPGTGHFIHTDEPVRFASDVADFVLTGGVNVLGTRSIDALVNAPVAASNIGAAPAGAQPSTEGLSK